MRRKKEDDELTRQALLKEALAVFSEKGYEGTRLSDIADRANVSRGAIYWHFCNKEKLFLELIKDRVSPLFQLVESTLNEEGTPLQNIRNLMQNIFDKMSTDPEFQRNQKLEFIKPVKLSDFKTINAFIESQVSGFTEQFIKIIKAGQKNGEIITDQNPKDISLVMIAFIRGMTHLMMNHDDREYLRKRTSLFIDIFLGSISRKK